MDEKNNGNEKLTGTCENIVYQNEVNGYTVCDINCDGVPVTVVGVLPMLNVGDTVTVVGSWTHHSSFGKQFKAEHWEKQLPATKEHILSYLSSGAIKGIGPVLAKRIVDKYGEDSLDVIENHPEWLADIKGVTIKKACEMSESYRDQTGLHNIMMYFNGMLGPATAVKVYKRWGAASVDVIKSNPYMLCEEITGVGFERADNIARELGIDSNSPFRLETGVKYVLSLEVNRNGNCYLPQGMLITKSAELLQATEGGVAEAVGRLTARGELVAVRFGEEVAIYLCAIYSAERYCADKLYELSKTAVNIPVHRAQEYIEDVEYHDRIEFADKQREAIVGAVTNGMLIVTGGPGTGKTTVIKAILRLYDAIGIATALAAPTGRAAKRMSLSTGREAKTIHRLLDAEVDVDGKMHFAKNEGNPLEYGAVIIDETSMTDILLMSSLLKALRPGTKVIFIGDSDQLPPVGAGDCLRDMLESNAVKYVKLDVIFRQANDSLIVVNAHNINSGRMPELSSRDKDFFFMKRNSSLQVTKLCTELLGERLPKAYGYDPFSDIQIITPTRKGEMGTLSLNKLLQAKLNPPLQGKNEHRMGDIIFREGDKVMQIKNDYSIPWHDKQGRGGEGIFNGDMGIIREINLSDETMEIELDDKIVKYEFSQCDELEHAYAVTVHKSQGSEYPCIVIPVLDAPRGLLTRSILYTAVTRAQQMVILVGSEHIIDQMVKNNRHSKRYTGLMRMLKALNEK